jgi:tetratricopeptide (TPR) repeat protein
MHRLPSIRFRIAASLVALAALLPPQGAFAQTLPDSALDESVVEKSRELYREANEHVQRKEWAKARAALLAAWSLGRHYSIAANLGECELALGRHRDAAEYLDFALRSWGTAYPEAKQKAQTMMDEALKHVAVVEVVSAVEGADVTVGGVVMGRTPLEAPLFLEPGSHELDIWGPGVPHDAKTVTLTAGERTRIQLGSAPKEPKPGSPAAGQDKNQEEGAGNAKPIVVGAGAALTLISATVAVVYMSKASNAEGDAQALQQKRDAIYGPAGCLSSGGAGSQLCAELATKLDDRDAANRTESLAWIGTGVFAAATVATYFLWPESEPSAVGVRPVVAPGFAAISLEGRY